MVKTQIKILTITGDCYCLKIGKSPTIKFLKKEVMERFIDNFMNEEGGQFERIEHEMTLSQLKSILGKEG